MVSTCTKQDLQIHTTAVSASRQVVTSRWPSIVEDEYHTSAQAHSQGEGWRVSPQNILSKQNLKHIDICTGWLISRYTVLPESASWNGIITDANEI